MKVILCGGGIIGAATAYFLAKLNVPCIIVEQTDIASAASGKAGGFLARNWCSSNASDQLAKLSFDLHMEFARMFNDVDYRRVDTYAASITNMKPDKRITLDPEHSWIDGNVTEHTLLETKENTAQVNPHKLCHKLISEAIRLTEGRTRVVVDTVSGLIFDTETTDSGNKRQIRGVKLISGGVLEADKALICMGPWSFKAAKWLPADCTVKLPHVFGHRAHSIVLTDTTMDPSNPLNPSPSFTGTSSSSRHRHKAPKKSSGIPGSCLFLQYRNSKGVSSPEIYPRPDGTVYISGLSDDKELPDSSGEVEVEKWRCTCLREVAYATCSALEPSVVLSEQACYLPMTDDGLPVIGKLLPGLYIATGHSCWGILNSTGTGLAMADLMVHGKPRGDIDLSPFSPGRFQ